MRLTQPFGLVVRDGKVVGCWYATGARLVRGRNGSATTVHVNCHGLARTADGRVAGTHEIMALHPGLPQMPVRRLSEACGKLPRDARRLAAHDFVEGLRGAAKLATRGWDPARARMALWEASVIDGFLGWRHDEDTRATLAAMRGHDVARSATLGRFLTTLDPALVGKLRPHDWEATGTDEHDTLLGEAGPVLDRTFGLVAPLQARVLAVLDDRRQVDRILRTHAYRADARTRRGADGHVARGTGRAPDAEVRDCGVDDAPAPRLH